MYRELCAKKHPWDTEISQILKKKKKKMGKRYYQHFNSNIYNHGNNIVGLFDVLPNFPFTTSETKRD